VLDFVQQQIETRRPGFGRVEEHLPDNLDGLLAVIDSCDIVVATRYHGILFGIHRGRLTLGICYQSKSRRLLELAGLGEFAIDAEGLTGARLLSLIARAAARGPDLADLAARADALHEACNRGFDQAIERCLLGAARRDEM
jgi:polysaccharide pyruvyl transferase WcaK-like protein